MSFSKSSSTAPGRPSSRPIHMERALQAQELADMPPHFQRSRSSPGTSRLGRYHALSEPEWLTAILVAGEAGLRMGEIIALQWSDINFAAGNLVVRRSSWLGIVGTTKSGRDRRIPLSKRLTVAL